MAPNRIMRAGAVRRGAALLAAALAGAALLGGCGGGDDATTEVAEKEADAEVLNDLLGRQLAAIEAYDRSLPGLGGTELTLARQFRAQEQEHVDAIVQALRGLEAATEPPEEEIDEVEGLRDEREYLEFLYEVESATIDAELSAIASLSSSWLPPLLTTIAANQAQHLVLLRRALGAKPRQSAPSAFEDGTTPAP